MNNIYLTGKMAEFVLAWKPTDGDRVEIPIGQTVTIGGAEGRFILSAVELPDVLMGDTE